MKTNQRKPPSETDKKRFDVDYYTKTSSLTTSHEEIIRASDFKEVIQRAKKTAIEKGMDAIVIYHKKWAIGTMDNRNNYEYEPGRNWYKNPLPYEAILFNQ